MFGFRYMCLRLDVFALRITTFRFEAMVSCHACRFPELAVQQHSVAVALVLAGRLKSASSRLDAHVWKLSVSN